jgi:hypothetical protein
MSGDRLPQPASRRLGEDQGTPGDFLVGFTEGLMDRRQQLLRDSQPPELARAQAMAEAVQAFTASADQRDWTVEERRIASLADDTLGLEDEYREQHGYEPELARVYAVGEVLDGERAREEVPLPWWRETDPPRPPGRTRPDSDTDRARTREADGER